MILWSQTEFDQRIAEFLLISRDIVSGVKFGREINLLLCFPFPSRFEHIIAGTAIMSQLFVSFQNNV